MGRECRSEWEANQVIVRAPTSRARKCEDASSDLVYFLAVIVALILSAVLASLVR